MDKTEALGAFSALGHDARLDVFRLLISAGDKGMLSGEIGERLGIRQNTASNNLNILLNAGLIRNVREGRTVRYYANFDAIRGLLSFLMSDCCGGSPELCQPLIAQIAS